MGQGKLTSRSLSKSRSLYFEVTNFYLVKEDAISLTVVKLEEERAC